MDYTLLKLTTDKTVHSGFATQLVIPWDTYDNMDTVLWSSSNPTKIVIPEGVSKIRFSCGIAISANDAGDRQIYLRKNGSDYPLGYISDIILGNLTSTSGNSWTDISAIMKVVPDDYFELVLFQTSGSDITLRALGSTWFQCEILA